VSLALQMLPDSEGYWSVLSVHRGASIVARRRLADDDDEADRVRRGFIEVVAAMSDAAYERADWQAVLDAVPVEPGLGA
jgi:hypothetical protein